MASGKSTYLAQKILDHMFGQATYTFPSTVYVALYTDAQDADNGGTEFTGNNYSRVAVDMDTDAWTRSDETISNDEEIAFAVLTGGAQTSMSFGILDASSGGNLLYWGDLSATFQKEFGNYDQPTFPAGALTVTES